MRFRSLLFRYYSIKATYTNGTVPLTNHNIITLKANQLRLYAILAIRR